MHFRNASPLDASSLAAVSMEVWVGTYLREGVSTLFADYALAEFTAGKFEAILSSDREMIVVSENRNGIDGFIRLSFESPAPLPGSPLTEIKTLYVQPRHQGKGIGRGLLLEALARCAELQINAVWLSVNSENTAALNFYTRMGFRTFGQTHFRIGNEAYLNYVLTLNIG